MINKLSVLFNYYFEIHVFWISHVGWCRHVLNFFFFVENVDAVTHHPPMYIIKLQTQPNQNPFFIWFRKSPTISISRFSTCSRNNTFLMELTKISSSSSSYLTILNYNRSAALTRKHTTIRCRKQGLSVLPMFILVSKFNDKQVNPRRSANYHSSISDHKLIWVLYHSLLSKSHLLYNTSFPHLFRHICTN